MRRARNGLFAAAVIAALAFGWWGAERWRHRFVQEDRDLVSLLPSVGGATFFVDLRAVQRAGLLEPAKVDPDYSRFLNGIGLDPMRDLDAIAGRVGTVPVFAVRGSITWRKIQRYAQAHGGVCAGSVCRTSVSARSQELRIERIQPDVLLLFSGSVPEKPLENALNSREQAWRHVRKSMADQSWWASPVWVDVDPAILPLTAESPAPFRLFALVMAASRRIVFDVDDAGESLVLRMQAEFENHAAAETARAQLDLQTKMMQLTMAREHKDVNRADLSGLITAGVFDVSDRHLAGQWPIRPELLASLR